MNILIIPDTHITLKNPSNRVDLVNETIGIFKNISENIIPENNIDMVIQLGDLFDRGYDKLPTQEWGELLRHFNNIKSQVNNHMYLLLGNHELTYSRNNPTFLITNIVDEEMNAIYRNEDTLSLTEQIWTAPANLKIGNTTIHFNHFRKDKKYKVDGSELNEINIGLYHDDFVSFESQEKLYHHGAGMGIDTGTTSIFDNIDMAISGHTHIPLNDIHLPNERNTLLIRPGAIMNNSSAEKHTYVEIPILRVNDGEVRIDKYLYHLPQYSETFIVDKVDENKSIYEMAKLMRDTKLKASTNEDFETMMASIDPEIERLIRKIDTYDEIESILLHDTFIQNELNGKYEGRNNK